MRAAGAAPLPLSCSHAKKRKEWKKRLEVVQRSLLPQLKFRLSREWREMVNGAARSDLPLAFLLCLYAIVGSEWSALILLLIVVLLV